ncbi:MAG TPA: phosphatidylglycerol lysyltransferase domain-containing protein [Mycobacteriales bacterium]|nr:phosphatidylglycerol lysyltransferase domain-containing protein [Mycobacteriales bacterium]
MSTPTRGDEERRRPVAARWAVSSDRTATVVAAATWLLGLLTVISALLPGQRDRVRYLTRIVGVPTEASATATGVAATLGFLLIWLASGLRRRKRRAWRAAVVVTAVVAVSHVAKGLDFEEAAVSMAILVMLIASRSEFYALGDPVTRWMALRVFVQFVLIGVALGVALLLINQNRVIGRPSVREELEHVLLGLVGIRGPLTFSSDRVADVVSSTLLGFGALTAFSTAYLILRPSQPVPLLGPEDETRLRELLVRHGRRDSLGYFALRRDKSVIWSPSGKAAITYRVLAGVALASGDPIGDPEAWPGAIEEFMELARLHAWVPAVIGCGEQGATVWRREGGLDALELGDEAILDTAEFGLEGRAMRGVRQACARLERAGYTVRVRRARDIPDEEFTELLRVAATWRGAAVERGFSMALSRLGDRADGDCVVVTAYQDGLLRGLLHFVPWGADGLSLDLMRRDRSADNGLNEYLIVRLVGACPALGVSRVSLNFSVFRAALERGERIGAGPVLRLWRGTLIFASRWWQIETLYRFNVKFRPAWNPRFISFPSTRDLPRIAIAALEAEAFLVRPHTVRRLLVRP